MVAQTVCAESSQSHIRPFSPRKDLRDLADLVEIAFGEELAATGSRMVEEMRQIAALGPLLYLASLVTPPMRGYVWVQDGRVVGNISLAQERGGRWVISNVAVLPEMRGQGIAGRLVDTALEHVRRRRGRAVTLQVRQDNAVAHALYAHRGFAVYDTVHELRLLPFDWPLVLRMSHPSVREMRRTDATKLQRLIRDSIPASARRYRDLSGGDDGASFWARLRRTLEQVVGPHERIGMVADSGEGPVGLATASVRLLATWHEMHLYVTPAQRGLVERPLVETLLARLDMAPRREVRATLSTTHPEGIEALHRTGFETVRVLDQMGCFL